MKTQLTVNMSGLKMIPSPLRDRFNLSSARAKFACLMVFIVVVVCVVWLLSPAKDDSRSEKASALPAGHSQQAFSNIEGNRDSAKSARIASPATQSGLGGMNAVELHVRESAFFQQLKRKETPLDASYDLYFLYQDEKAKSRAEVVFRTLSLQSFDAETSRIEIQVPEQDVPIILSLEMMGEYQLVRRSLRSSDSSGPENIREQGQVVPLGEREWVRQLLGDGSVVVVP
jgi:hypothetical protein